MNTEERLARLEALIGIGLFSDSGWVDLGSVGTYATNWGAYADSRFRPMARRFPNGLVLLRGALAKSAALGVPETMFTFNRSWWPGDLGYTAGGSELIFSVSQSGAAFADVRLGNTGILQLDHGSATWTSLVGVIYTLVR